MTIAAVLVLGYFDTSIIFRAFACVLLASFEAWEVDDGKHPGMVERAEVVVAWFRSLLDEGRFDESHYHFAFAELTALGAVVAASIGLTFGLAEYVVAALMGVAMIVLVVVIKEVASYSGGGSA